MISITCSVYIFFSFYYYVLVLLFYYYVGEVMMCLGCWFFCTWQCRCPWILEEYFRSSGAGDTVSWWCMWLGFWKQNLGSQQEDYVLFVEQPFPNPLSYFIQKENKLNDKHELSSRKALNEYMTVSFLFIKVWQTLAIISLSFLDMCSIFFYFAKEFYPDM